MLRIVLVILQSVFTVPKRLNHILTFLSLKYPSSDVLLYSNSKSLPSSVFISPQFQVSVSTFSNSTDDCVLIEKMLSAQFEQVQEQDFITVFDAASAYCSTLLLIKVGGVLQSKTLKTSQVRRIPQYIIIWLPNADGQFQSFQDYWSKLMYSTEILSPFLINSQIFIVEFSETTTNSLEYSAYEIYCVPYYNDTFIPILNKLELENMGKLGITRSDFRGGVVRATAPEKNLTQGEVTFKENVHNHDAQFLGGFGVDIFNALKDSLQFNSKVLPTLDWAKQFPNGSWFGMAREVIDGKADISVAKTSMLLQRVAALQYLVPTHELGLFAFFEQPSANSVRHLFFEPYTSSLWYTCGVTYTIIFFCSISVSFFKVCIIKTDNKGDEILLREPFIWSIGTFCQQGWHTTPSSISLRIIFVCGIFLGLILFVAYSATLVSIFSTKSIPIKSLHDLLKSNLKLAVDKNNRGASSLVTESHNDGNIEYSSLAKHLKQRFGHQTPGNSMSIPEGIPLVFRGHTAFLTFKDSFYTTTRNIYHTTDKMFCEKVASVAVLGSRFTSGLFVAKNSPFKEYFNIKLLVLYTSGLKKRYVAGYENEYTPVCDAGCRGSNSFDIGGDDVFIAYVILAIGISSSLFLLLVEYIIIYWNRNGLRDNYEVQPWNILDAKHYQW